MIRDTAHKLREIITQSGPVDVGTFMMQAVGHYYKTRDPLGLKGDFTTAPEISQMFGELIGAWAADTWIKLGGPSSFSLIECGPGRGTLMADALRATKSVPGFHEALNLFLLETSPVLRAKQKEKLGAYRPVWLDTLADDAFSQIPGPVIFIGNELLDALPIRQAQMTDEGWRERVIDLREDKFVWSLAELPRDLKEVIPQGLKVAPGDIYELPDVRDNFMRKVCEIIKGKSGAALWIDYGHEKHALGDTLQALKDHQYVDVLSDVGDADVTSHVNFAAVKDVAKRAGLDVHGPADQGAFLEALGIGRRAHMLQQNATQAQKKDIAQALERLCATSQMGRLFKVITLSFAGQGRIELAGF